MSPIHVLSLGAGVQSSCLDIGAHDGFFTPKPIAAIFADTQEEPREKSQSLYDWLGWLEEKSSSIKHYRVTRGSLGKDSVIVHTSKKSGRKYIKAMIPAYLQQPDGKIGLLGRICTVDYKIVVVIRKIREIVGRPALAAWRKKHKAALKVWNEQVAKRKKKNPTYSFDLEFRSYQKLQSDPLIIQWIGISADEAERQKDSRVPWIKHYYPLIEKNMTRQDCVSWMLKNGYPEPPRSACVFCPFHSDKEWLRIKSCPKDWNRVVEFERQLQDAASRQNALTGKPFLHKSCKPIDQVDFTNAKGYEQISLFGNDCEGLCGV
jgi:hypothetical protein